MAFWGAEVKPGRATPYVPPPEGTKLHLSQACLNTKAKPGAKAALKVRVSEDGEELLVCSLREGGTESVGLDLIFDQYTEFNVEGGASIHLTGYYMPEYEMGGEDDDEDDDNGYDRILGYDEYGMPVLASEFDSEEESDEDDEDEEDSDSDVNPPRRIVIEDVTDGEKQGGATGGRQLKALPAPEQANGGKAAGFSDDDVEASDEEGSEEEGSEDDEGGSEEEEGESDGEGDSEEGSGEEEEQSSEEEEKPQQAGQKRKAEEQPSSAKQQQAKQAKQQSIATPATAAKQGAQQRQQAATPATAGKQQQQQEKQQQQKEQQQKAEAPASTGKSKVRKFANGFEIEDVKMGRPDGKLAKAGKKILVRYVGRLKSNGKVFDQTKGTATFSFRVGVGEVIKGWDRGVEGMRVGDKRRLTIPPAMAYGSTGVRGAIPPNAWLVFDVELVDVKG